ncbi:hypothetical protein C0966_00020 [Bacillus methanolicus]|uniref:transporter suffix domain-containing protein n=1 Tax=Bacillus methanolicus TaxID=1471 RepID=UPI00237FF843|nr:transporter suffix domain-containing protein [Bacillus methanolicus]MDE3837794.1 hypothetical protein [Bacillus methanolicus]
MSQKQKTLSSKRSTLRKVGIGLIIMSFVLYGALLLVPLIPFSTGTKVIISSVLVLSGEITFWVGGIILGKEVVTKYRKYFNPLNWFRKNKNP